MGFLVTLETITILLAMAIPGFIITKLKLVDTDNAIKVLSVVLLYICQPFITINAFLNIEYKRAILLNLLLIFIITVFLMTILLVLAYAMFYKDTNSSKRGVFSFAASLSNAGYLAIPLLQILTNNNSQIILYATTSLVGFNLVSWTLGVYIISKDKKFISLKNIFLNLPTLSFLITLPFFLLNINFIRFPQLNGLAQITGLLANMMAPISMLIIGMQFSKITFKELFNDHRVYIATAFKLVFSPILAFGLVSILSCFWNISALRLNIIATAAMPSATLVMMFSALYNSDTKSAAKAVLFSTVLSIVTIPLALYLFV